MLRTSWGPSSDGTKRASGTKSNSSAVSTNFNHGGHGVDGRIPKIVLQCGRPARLRAVIVTNRGNSNLWSATWFVLSSIRDDHSRPALPSTDRPLTESLQLTPCFPWFEFF